MIQFLYSELMELTANEPPNCHRANGLIQLTEESTIVTELMKLIELMNHHRLPEARLTAKTTRANGKIQQSTPNTCTLKLYSLILSCIIISMLICQSIYISDTNHKKSLCDFL